MSHIEKFAAGLPLDDAAAVLDALEKTLTEQKDFHRLFDAQMLRVRSEMGLPLTQPTSLQGIPAEQEDAYRDAYRNAARVTGQKLLEAGKLSDAWAYFRTISEPERIREAIEQKAEELGDQYGPELDELLNLALYENAHPVAGVRLLLKSHGTCNTVTAMSQMVGQMSPAERRESARVMVAHLYNDLRSSVVSDLERHGRLLKGEQPLSQLIAGQESLFAEGNYHIDVSHLHSIVGFARHLHREDPELRLAVEMSVYGQQLAEHLRYPADVPFDDYYLASEYFLRALLGDAVDEGLQWFCRRLDTAGDDDSRRLISFVIVDLAQRVGRMAEMLEKTAHWLGQMEDPGGFSFAAACAASGRLDLLESEARSNDDVFAMATAILLRS